VVRQAWFEGGLTAHRSMRDRQQWNDFFVIVRIQLSEKFYFQFLLHSGAENLFAPECCMCPFTFYPT